MVTIAELLRDGGYDTLMSGKWHLGETLETAPVSKGFSRSFAMLGAADNHFLWRELRDPLTLFSEPVKYIEDDRFIEALPQNYYSSDYFTDRLLDFLGEREGSDKPFFAYLPFSAPHFPLQAPAESIAPYRGMYDDGPDALRTRRLAALRKLGLIGADVVAHPVVADTKPWAEMDAQERAFSARTMEVFAGMVQRMDENIGRVVAYLRARGALDNTLIFFCSDNGAEGAVMEAQPIAGPLISRYILRAFDNRLENLGAGSSYIWYGPRWAQAATAPSRLHKAYTTEGGIRVVGFMHWPALARSGSIGEAFSTVMDVPATLMELAGLDLPGESYRGRAVAPMRGRSMLSWLDGRSERVHAPDYATGWELFGRRAIRQDNFKALYVPKPSWAEAVWELYDLARDPGETHDLAGEMPEKLETLLGLWRQYMAETGVATIPASAYEIDPEMAGPAVREMMAIAIERATGTKMS